MILQPFEVFVKYFGSKSSYKNIFSELITFIFNFCIELFGYKFAVKISGSQELAVMGSEIICNVNFPGLT